MVGLYTTRNRLFLAKILRQCRIIGRADNILSKIENKKGFLSTLLSVKQFWVVSYICVGLCHVARFRWLVGTIWTHVGYASGCFASAWPTKKLIIKCSFLLHSFDLFFIFFSVSFSLLNDPPQTTTNRRPNWPNCHPNTPNFNPKCLNATNRRSNGQTANPTMKPLPQLPNHHPSRPNRHPKRPNYHHWR